MLNRFYFTNLKKYQIAYEVKENNKVVRRGKVSLDVAPQAKKELAVNVGGLKAKAGTEYFVNFSVTTLEPEPLIPVGYEIAHEQFRLPVEALDRSFTVQGPALQCSENGNLLTVQSSRVSFVFDKSTGLVTSYKVKVLNISTTDSVCSLTSGVDRTTTTTEARCRNVCKSGNSRARTST